MIFKKDSGDDHKFCTTLMEKTVGGIGIINSDLFSDQFFLQCGCLEENDPLGCNPYNGGWSMPPPLSGLAYLGNSRLLLLV
jgi:hypothetical protein